MYIGNILVYNVTNIMKLYYNLHERKTTLIYVYDVENSKFQHDT